MARNFQISSARRYATLNVSEMVGLHDKDIVTLEY